MTIVTVTDRNAMVQTKQGPRVYAVGTPGFLLCQAFKQRPELANLPEELSDKQVRGIQVLGGRPQPIPNDAKPENTAILTAENYVETRNAYFALIDSPGYEKLLEHGVVGAIQSIEGVIVAQKPNPFWPCMNDGKKFFEAFSSVLHDDTITNDIRAGCIGCEHRGEGILAVCERTQFEPRLDVPHALTVNDIEHVVWLAEA